VRLLPPSPVTDDAEFDQKREHRYWLSRLTPPPMAPAGVVPFGVTPVALCLALNPSKAGAKAKDDDHTVRKWRGFAERWGWGGFWVGNLFSYIETESVKLRQLSYAQAVGEHNDAVLKAMIAAAPEILLCWGNNVPHALRRRVDEVLELVKLHKGPLTEVHCLGLTAQGAPWHPLRLGYDTKRVPWLFKEKPSRRD
jgi:hypothetical protein